MRSRIFLVELEEEGGRVGGDSGLCVLRVVLRYLNYRVLSREDAGRNEAAHLRDEDSYFCRRQQATWNSDDGQHTSASFICGRKKKGVKK